MCHRLLVGALGFLKAGCKLQGGGRKKKTRKTTVRPKQLKGGIGSFGGASSDEDGMEFENGDKVPVTPTNSPRGGGEKGELEYPWEQDEDELECMPCEQIEEEEEGQLVKTKPNPIRPSEEEGNGTTKLTSPIDHGARTALGEEPSTIHTASLPRGKER